MREKLFEVELAYIKNPAINKDYKTKREVLPKPKGKLQNIVHLADYLSSRKYFDTFDFNVMVKRDRNY